ncbi:MAG: hypothetical protein FJ266_03545 [Planctomycetes bacterium]|nr:hypothetical protein [Planctomycetota bacterium]
MSIPDHDNIKKWAGWFRTLPTLWKFITVVIVLILFGGFFYFQYMKLPSLQRDINDLQKINTSLSEQNKELKTEIMLLRKENEGLRETVAPLIRQAAKEFPGEEINTSLNKIIERMETESPYKKPIATLTATVEVLIESNEQINAHFMDRGGFLAFAKGTEPLLMTSSHESWGRQTGQGQVFYSGIFSLNATDSAVGRPLFFLKDVEYIQIVFDKIAPKSKVISGRAICIVNNLIRFEFVIPPQETTNNMIFIRDLSQFHQLLKESGN